MQTTPSDLLHSDELLSKAYLSVTCLHSARCTSVHVLSRTCICIIKINLPCTLRFPSHTSYVHHRSQNSRPTQVSITTFPCHKHQTTTFTLSKAVAVNSKPACRIFRSLFESNLASSQTASNRRHPLCLL